MNMAIRTYFKWLIILGFLISACSRNTEYNRYKRLVKKELAKGIREDSLFLGIRFGMLSKDFYMHCWDLNKRGVITDGNNNTAVLYKLPNQLKYPVSMNFYPDFSNHKIYKMRVDFMYDSWAPWNKKLFSDSLQLDVVRLYKKWYGDRNFIKMTDSARGPLFVKVDGNRRIIIGRYDDSRVKVDYTDLTVDNDVKK